MSKKVTDRILSIVSRGGLKISLGISAVRSHRTARALHFLSSLLLLLWFATSGAPQPAANESSVLPGGNQLTPSASCNDGWHDGLPVNGINGNVNDIAFDGAGGIYIGGTFTLAGNVAVNNIAKWDGTSWSSLGTGLNGSVSSIKVSGTDVYVGGWFTTAGGTPANYIAKWNGSSWSPSARDSKTPLMT